MFRLPLVYIAIPDQWQKAMIYFWNWIAVFVPGTGQAQEHVCDCINDELSGEVASATRRGMQHYLVLNVLYMFRVLNEWLNELLNEWVNELIVMNE